MRPVNEIATIILFFLVAVFVLHLIEGDAVEWVKSKFTAKDATSSLPSGTALPGGVFNNNVPGRDLIPSPLQLADPNADPNPFGFNPYTFNPGADRHGGLGPA